MISIKISEYIQFLLYISAGPAACFSATQLSLLNTCRASTRTLPRLCYLGRRLHAKKRLISQATLVIFGQRRKAMQSAGHVD